LVPDFFSEKTWWLSSGDKAEENFIWRSNDDGITWKDATCYNSIDSLPDLQNQKLIRRAQRFTDLIVTEKFLIWGSDDLLGTYKNFDPIINNKNTDVGSKLFIAEKKIPLEPFCLGYIGHPIRSIIDINLGWIILTEAHYSNKMPQIYFLSKENFKLIHLFNLNNFGNSTGFTYSRSSKKSNSNVFFTFKNSNDIIKNSFKILRWKFRID
jgi:hypothetical protein